MRISGSATLHASRAEVWDALNDPAVLVATIPGCQRLEEVDADAYAMTVSAGVGSITGVYQGEVRLADKQHPESFVLRASGAGTPGTLSADVSVTLEDDADATRVTYEADAVIGGLIAGVGQRLIVGVAKRTATEFFTAVDSALVSGPSTSAQGGQVERPDQAGLGTGRVFTAPGRTPARGTAVGFRGGVVVGAAAALLGALVGGWLASRRRT